MYRLGPGDLRTPGQLRQRAAELDDLLRRLLRQTVQRSRSNQHRQMHPDWWRSGCINSAPPARWKLPRSKWMASSTPPVLTTAPSHSTPAPAGRIWIYQRQLPSDIRPCCGRVNRGLAILGGKVFLGTLDAHVVALDAKTGAVIWDVTAADYRTGPHLHGRATRGEGPDHPGSLRWRIRRSRIHRRL